MKTILLEDKNLGFLKKILISRFIPTTLNFHLFLYKMFHLQ